MKRFLAFMFIALLLSFGSWIGAQIEVDVSTVITIGSRAVNDTGTYVTPDSVRIVAYCEGAEAFDAWFVAADDQCDELNDQLVFFDAFGDIDGDAGTGIYQVSANFKESDDEYWVNTWYSLVDTTDQTYGSIVYWKADSVAGAVTATNKANFKATGFATTSECDSIEAAISDANKANFKADVAAIADTANAILDTIQAHAPHGDDWGQGAGSLTAITDTVNAILDTLQAGYGSQVDQGDVVKVSGDATAADNLETMLDGTGGQKFSLASLEIRASSNDTALIAIGAGDGFGMCVLGGSSAHGFKAKGGTNKIGIVAIGVGTGSGFSTQGGVSGGYGLKCVGYGNDGHGAFFEGTQAGGHGIFAVSGVSGDGIRAYGVSGDGMSLAKGGAGYDLNLDGGGTIHGTIDRCTYVDSTDTVIKDVGSGASNWSDAQRDSVLNTILDANKVNYMRWTTAQRDSILNTILDANKVNYMRWTATQRDSVLNTILDANKANFMADVDSILNALADANKANFMADVDSILQAIADANKANFKADMDSANAYVDTGYAMIDSFFATNFGCAGAGTRTVVVECLDYTDSTTGISNVRVGVYDSTAGEYKANLITNTSGLCTLSLDDGRYTIHLKKTADAVSGGSPQYKGVASDTTHTFYIDQFDPGVPPSADMCRVWCIAYDLQNKELVGARLTISVPGRFTPLVYDGTPVSRYSVSAVSNDTGYVFVDIYEMEGANRIKCQADTSLTVKAYIELRNSVGGLISRTYKAIPDAVSWEIEW